MFSTSAAKIANIATEGAIKVGGIATQKVAEIGNTVGDKVWFILDFLFHLCFLLIIIF